MPSLFGELMTHNEIREYRSITQQAIKGLVVPMLAVPTLMLLTAALLIGVYAALFGHSGVEYTLGFTEDAATPAFLVPAKLSIAIYFILAIEFAFLWNSWTRSDHLSPIVKFFDLLTRLTKLWSSIVSEVSTALYLPRLLERSREARQYATFKETPYLAGERPQLE